MMPKKLGNRWFGDPVDASGRETSPQPIEHRQRVHDIANRGEFDQQNAAKFAISEGCEVGDQNGTCRVKRKPLITLIGFHPAAQWRPPRSRDEPERPHFLVDRDRSSSPNKP
ncbi:MAG: hypothetical protein JO228_05050 [Xanthobacteraceae bacterium]|nr:hypothetical protein [Xanthobacteraceae bacterium]